MAPVLSVLALSSYQSLTQKLKLYTQSLGDGDSIIRSFILIDHAYFVVEQEISVTVIRQSGAWTGEYSLT